MSVRGTIVSAVFDVANAQVGSGSPIAAPRLAEAGELLRRRLWALIDESSSDRRQGVRLVARGRTEMREAMTRLARSTTFSVRNAAEQDRFDTTGRTTELNRAAHRRGVVMDRVVNQATSQDYPLLRLTGLYNRRLVVAPVRISMIVVDQSRLVFPGPRLECGDGTMWTTTDEQLVADANEVMRLLLQHGTRIPTLPPTETNHRLLDVLTALVNGLTDTAIAHQVGVSVRCVQKDIHTIKDIAGVSSRMELAWSLGFHPR